MAAFEHNPWFLHDCDRFGVKDALRDWIMTSKSSISRQQLTTLWGDCPECGLSTVWYRPSVGVPTCTNCRWARKSHVRQGDAASGV